MLHDYRPPVEFCRPASRQGFGTIGAEIGVFFKGFTRQKSAGTGANIVLRLLWAVKITKFIMSSNSKAGIQEKPLLRVDGDVLNHLYRGIKWVTSCAANSSVRPLWVPFVGARGGLNSLIEGSLCL